jgi:hypothetical protein
MPVNPAIPVQVSLGSGLTNGDSGSAWGSGLTNGDSEFFQNLLRFPQHRIILADTPINPTYKELSVYSPNARGNSGGQYCFLPA